MFSFLTDAWYAQLYVIFDFIGDNLYHDGH